MNKKQIIFKNTVSNNEKQSKQYEGTILWNNIKNNILKQYSGQYKSIQIRLMNKNNKETI